MSPDFDPASDPRRAMHLFQDAFDLAEPARADFLERICASDTELCAEVQSLLTAHARADSLVEDPGEGGLERAGHVIDRYELQEKIGEGGFGTVWVASQREPVQRQVALKILKAGMDTVQLVARFDAERQALARMDHPHIAQVFDGGATPEGRPYFVMELVHGVPITEYCDRANMPPAERLALFIKVCRAVQHAHHKGVIHRDLKPSNVLVTELDGEPIPKVIDFGIAKAMDGNLAGETAWTEFRQMLGTPEYTAPEQAALSTVDVDARADVYGLGVLLYELLTGTVPHDRAKLQQTSYQEVLRCIQEDDPPTPSKRVSTLDEQGAQIARHRSVFPRGLSLSLRGDLDWITMRALEKDRARRYETAAALADDVQRHLRHEPVVAGPPGGWYRLTRYARRHRLGLSAAVSVAVALIVGLSVATAGWAEASTQAELAESRAVEAATQAATAASVIGLIQEMLGSSDPHAVNGPDYTVRELLDSFGRDLDRQLANEPEVEATVRSTIGRSYLRLGLTDKARPQLERALALRQQSSGAASFEASESQLDWVQYLHDIGDFEQAGALASSVFSARRGLSGSEDDRAIELSLRADLLRHLRRYPEALECAREYETIMRERGVAGRENLAAILTRRGRIHSELDELDEAERCHRESLELRRALFEPPHPDLASSLNNLADVWLTRGDYKAAAEVFEQVLEMDRATFPAQHPTVARTLNNLAEALRRQGELASAEQYHRQALAMKRAFLGDDDADVALSQNNLGVVLFQQDDAEAAVALFRQAWQTRSTILGPGHRRTRTSAHNLATALRALGRNEEAAQVVAEQDAAERIDEGMESPPQDRKAEKSGR